MKISIDSEGEARVPVLAGTDVSLARVVAACHGAPIDEALETLGVDGLNRDSLDDVLVYCARKDCEGEGATCPGCRLGVRAQGIATVDEFVASHRKITVRGEDIVLSPW